MLDLSLVPSLAWAIASGGPGTDVTPIDTATTSVVSYVLGYGLAGLIALAFFFRLIVPASVVKEARENARADLKAELDRVLAEKAATETRLIAERHEVEEQREEALKAMREQIPILVSFTSASQSLIPLLQQLVSQRRGAARERDARD